ncbi:metallophosphoesterase family protein [Acuticoccus sp.]|uniref:metallophosphoesterase family protein n=1 Tax=Acuticoccus sp. TaxID=1904378 RepID=UPI003B52BC0E
MSSFRFLHAADVHLGSPFKGLAIKDEVIARRFAQATRTAFTALIDRAIELKVAFLIVAGDLYDGEWRDNTVGLYVARELSRLALAGIPTVLLKGNHDADSVVTGSITLPDHVHQFETQRPSTVELGGVVLHGQGFAKRAVPDTIVRDYPPRAPGAFNIGVLHTSLTGSTQHETYAPCSLEDLARHGYDYWALGHVHDYAVVARDPTIVFPGNLQGRNVREAGEKGAVLVSVEDGRVASIERVIVDAARWATMTLDVTDCGDVEDVLRRVEREAATLAAGLGDRLLALRVCVVGASALAAGLMAQRGQLRDEVEAACQRVHPDIWLEALRLEASAPPPSTDADPGFDFAAEVRAIADDPRMLQVALELLRGVGAKLPHGTSLAQDDGEEAAALLAEAAALLVARTGD